MKHVERHTLKPLVVALALTLPAGATFAAAMSETSSASDVVRTKADQNVHQQYGRDSVYAFSTDRKPYKPEQTESRAATTESPAANDSATYSRDDAARMSSRSDAAVTSSSEAGYAASDSSSRHAATDTSPTGAAVTDTPRADTAATDTASSEHRGFFGRMKAMAAAGWDRTRSMFSRNADGNASAMPPNHPQPYGRAGGYVGWERIAVLEMVPTAANSGVGYTQAEWDRLADLHGRDRSTGYAARSERSDRSSATGPATSSAYVRDHDAATTTSPRSSAALSDSGRDSDMTGVQAGHSSVDTNASLPYTAQPAPADVNRSGSDTTANPDTAATEPVYSGTAGTDADGRSSNSAMEDRSTAARPNDLQQGDDRR